MTNNKTVKVIFVGKPGMGKTTMKKVIFEGTDPNELILFPLEATIGSKYSVHDFMDLNISLVDTPGQSMPILLEDEDQQIRTFENASAIIYIFDYNLWRSQPNEVIEDIKRIYDINKKYEFGAKINLYLHKIDLIDQNIIGKYDLLKNQIINQLELPEELQIYFTSLHPNLIYTMYNALSDTLSTFSPDISNLKKIITKIINDLTKTICFVTNQDNNIISQAMTKDFDTKTIFSLYDKIIQMSQSGEGIPSNKESFELIESGSNFLNAMTGELAKFHFKFKKVILISETLGKNELIRIIQQLKNSLQRHYNSS